MPSGSIEIENKKKEINFKGYVTAPASGVYPGVLLLHQNYGMDANIRAYAEILIDLLKKWVPITYKAFCSYKLNSADLSQEALEVIKKMIKGKKVKRENTNLSKREWDELIFLIN